MFVFIGFCFVIYVVFVGNFVIVIVKFIVVGIFGSLVMFSEGVYLLVDILNEFLLLYGLCCVGKVLDFLYLFGYGCELYFWSFIVVLLVFVVGVGVLVYEGVQYICRLELVINYVLSYSVLGIFILFEGVFWWVVLCEFWCIKGKFGYFEVFCCSKDFFIFIVLLEDSVVLFGLGFVLIGLVVVQVLDMLVFDGVVLLCIVGVLVVIVFFLVCEIKGLLVGEFVYFVVVEWIMVVVEIDLDLCCVNGVIIMQMGLEQVVVMFSVEFEDDCWILQIEVCIICIEMVVKCEYLELVVLFIKLQMLEVYVVWCVVLVVLFVLE